MHFVYNFFVYVKYFRLSAQIYVGEISALQKFHVAEFPLGKISARQKLMAAKIPRTEISTRWKF